MDAVGTRTRKVYNADKAHIMAQLLAARVATGRIEISSMNEGSYVAAARAADIIISHSTRVETTDTFEQINPR